MLIDLTTIQLPQIIPSDQFNDFELSRAARKLLSDALGNKGYIFDRFTSRATTDPNNNNHAIIPNQYFLIAKKIHPLAAEAFKYYEIFEKIKYRSDLLYGNCHEIKENITNHEEIKKHFLNNEEIELFSKFIDKTTSEYRLKSKSLVNEERKPRGSKDCFGSLILKEINTPDASASILGGLIYDICYDENLYQQLNDLLEQPRKEIIKFNSTKKSNKPFLILAGISGTGKTRFVREQAKLTGSLESSYCLCPVRPDWHEPSDLLGYISRINDEAKFVTTETLKFIVSAWKAIYDAGAEIEPSHEENPSIVVSGNDDTVLTVPPYWLCLDEMNLAPVEQYFADYLSILETRRWEWDGDNFSYQSDALLKPLTIDQVDQNALRKELQLGEAYDDLWECFTKAGIPLPFNLMVAGTVNMDETTHGFSRKVLDRALSIDFGEFFPNDYAEFFEPTWQAKALSYPTHSQATQELLVNSFDSDGSKSIAFLQAVNDCLAGTPFQLAYRALNELLLAVINAQPQQNSDLQAVWDDFLMCKVLPRIEGDYEKLGGETSILSKLEKTLETHMTDIWHGDHNRPDLFREKNDGSALYIGCRSKAKIAWMQQKLTTNSFTSFWP